MAGYSQGEPVPNTQGCWYRIEIEECPVCGAGETHRTRMPPPAPPEEERTHFEHAYDYCMEWGSL